MSDDDEGIYGDLETEFNDQVAELKSIHQLVDTITQLLFFATYNVQYAGRSFRALKLLKLRLNPVTNNDKYRRMFGERLRIIDDLIRQAEPMVEIELLRGRAFMRENHYSPGSSAALLRLLDALFNELNIIKGDVGLGVRMRPVFSESDRINQAMD